MIALERDEVWKYNGAFPHALWDKTVGWKESERNDVGLGSLSRGIVMGIRARPGCGRYSSRNGLSGIRTG